MKKILSIIIIFILIISVFYKSYDKESNYKVVSYNGDNLRISIDGVSSSSLPSSGNYYLVDYECSSLNTKITWDRDNYKLEVSNKNKNAGVSCYLEFKSKPLLSEMSVGSYVKYVGDNGCEGNHCKGYNANYVSDEKMGYCNSSNYQFHVNGWRIAYIEDGSAVLISAGSTDCMCTSADGTPSSSSCSSGVSSSNINKHFDNMKSIALKYCNSGFIKNGRCDTSSIDNGYVKVIDANVFSKITGSTLSSSSCYGKSSNKSCGYTNDLIDNGGYYWYGTRYSSSATSTFLWNPISRHVSSGNSSHLCGVRPVLSLQSSIIVVGGDGTYDSPYEIDDYYFVINDGNWYFNSSSDLSNVELSLNVTDVVSKVCISVGTSSCSNYVDYSESYILDLSDQTDGEKTVYVYFKDSNNKIVDIMQRNIIIDRVAPSNNSVTFNESDGMFRTLNISSTGADYMCFSNNSNVNNCTNWVDYSTSYNYKFEEGAGSKTLYAFFKDVVGNVSSVSASTTCTNDCYYKYFMDANSNNYIFLMRNDGATTLMTTSSKQQWYTEGSQSMNVCGAYNRSSTAYIWCIGNDNNAYYKTSYSATSWNKVNVSSYIDISTYSYSIVPYSTSYAYIIRSDGMINRLSTSGLQVASSTWTYGYATDMLKCSSTYNSSSAIRVACIGKDGYYYYRDDYDTTTAYTKVSSILKLTNPLDTNSWIDMYSTTHTDIIQIDGSNMYNFHFTYNSTPSWYTSNIPGGGVKTCTSGGGLTNNYCIGNDNKLYYKSYNATSWTSTSVTIN